MHTSDQDDIAALIQAQLDAYNANDAAALTALYADDAELFQHPSTLLASGAAQIRERFTARFASARPQALLLHRIVLGDTVIDHETVSGAGADGLTQTAMVAIYQVRERRIATAWFMSAPA